MTDVQDEKGSPPPRTREENTALPPSPPDHDHWPPFIGDETLIPARDAVLLSVAMLLATALLALVLFL